MFPDKQFPSSGQSFLTQQLQIFMILWISTIFVQYFIVMVGDQLTNIVCSAVADLEIVFIK